jgi:hypothetical protein
MLDGIVMNIVDMPLQILFVSYVMFPEPSLPDAAFSLFVARGVLFRLDPAGVKALA